MSSGDAEHRSPFADPGIGCNLSQRSEIAHVLLDERDADLALCAPHYTAIVALLLFSSNRQHEFVRHVFSGRHHKPSAMVRHVPDHAKVLTATGALNRSSILDAPPLTGTPINSRLLR